MEADFAERMKTRKHLDGRTKEVVAEKALKVRLEILGRELEAREIVFLWALKGKGKKETPSKTGEGKTTVGQKKEEKGGEPRQRRRPKKRTLTRSSKSEPESESESESDILEGGRRRRVLVWVGGQGEGGWVGKEGKRPEKKKKRKRKTKSKTFFSFSSSTLLPRADPPERDNVL